MPTRFFVDEDDLTLGKALAELYENVVFSGHPALPKAPRQSLDDEWLEVVGASQLVVITRDQRMRYRPVEMRRWLEYGVRGFGLTGRTSQSTGDSLELLQKRWSEMEHIVASRAFRPVDVRSHQFRVREIQLR